MTTDTIYSTQQVITRYISTFQQTVNSPFTPRLTLSGLDGYLMQQIATIYALPPTIIDLTVVETLGASAVLWASTGDRIKQYVVKMPTEQASPIPDLGRLVPELLDMLNLDRRLLTSVETREGDDFPVWWQTVHAQINVASPLFFVIAAEPSDTLTQRLTEILAVHSSPIICVLGLGLSGESAAVEAAYALCNQQSAFHLILPRDGRAFWATSRLGLIVSRDNQYIRPLLTRLSNLFNSNFDFINLIESNILLRQQYQQTLIEHEEALRMQPKGPFPLVFDEPPIQDDINSAMGVRNWLGQIQKSVKHQAQTLIATGQHSDYQLEYLEVVIPSQMKPQQMYRGAAMIRNLSTQVWQSALTHPHPINIAYHWLDQASTMLTKEGRRTALQFSIGRGCTTYVTFDIEAPAQLGHYLFELDLVHEGISWFSDEGQSAPRMPVHVLES